MSTAMVRAGSSAMMQQSASLVRRARAGEQNAAALIYLIGEKARKGDPRATEAYTMIRSYIEHNTPQDFRFGDGTKPVVLETPGGMVPTRGSGIQIRRDPEMQKPPLPKGILNGILDPDVTGKCILNACQFRHGMHGAAVALAAGPPLTDHYVRHMASTTFGGEQARRSFLYGVQFCGEKEWNEVAPGLDMAGRKGLMIGQCIGRARHIQAMRNPRARIGAYSSVAGWELGE